MRLRCDRTKKRTNASRGDKEGLTDWPTDRLRVEREERRRGTKTWRNSRMGGARIASWQLLRRHRRRRRRQRRQRRRGEKTCDPLTLCLSVCLSVRPSVCSSVCLNRKAAALRIRNAPSPLLPSVIPFFFASFYIHTAAGVRSLPRFCFLGSSTGWLADTSATLLPGKKETARGTTEKINTEPWGLT